MADEKEKARKVEEEPEAPKTRGLGGAMKSVQLGKTPADAPTEGAAPAVGVVAQHTVAAGETLSQIALKHYGNAGREYWMAIYEANKAVIGANPGLIKPGMVLKIPERK
jgi:nucleoid-associated protein YgaU